MRYWAQHLRPDSMVWPYHTYCIWPCQARQNYSCTVRSIGGPSTRPHKWKIMGSMRKKPYRKKITSIELSEVYMWLVGILTTKRKSLMRVETCQEKYFTLWLFFYVNSFFRFNPQTVLLSGYIYISIWFVLHWTLDCSFVFEWRRSYLGSERIPRLCLADFTRTPYSFAYWSVQSYLLVRIDR